MLYTYLTVEILTLLPDWYIFSGQSEDKTKVFFKVGLNIKDDNEFFFTRFAILVTLSKSRILPFIFPN
jgi:hypothetical protein